jgi:hypothetical protein
MRNFVDFYCSLYIVRIIKSKTMRWMGHIARMGEVTKLYNLVGQPEGKRPLRRRKHRWEYNIKTHLREIGWEVD